MARDTITVTATVRAGVLPALTTPNEGNEAEVANSAGRTIVIYLSGLGGAAIGAGARTVLIQQVADPYGRIQNDSAFAVTNDAAAVFGPFPPNLYNQTDGTVQIDYDGLSTNQSVCALAITGA